MGRKTIKVASYFTKEELKLIKFVSNELLKVNERQFVKGAAIEMAQATLNMAQEKANAEAQQEAEGAKLMAKVMGEDKQRRAQHESEGFRVAADVHKHKQQLEHQRQQAERQSQQKPKEKSK